MTRVVPHPATLALAAALLAAPAFAANATLQRVVLLPALDRSSIVFELSAEPRHVSTRRVSDSIIEFEAGPGIESAVPQILKAPSNVRFVDAVTVRVTSTAQGPVVRARIALTTAAQAVVRSAGRRVYVDVSPLPAPGGAASGALARAATPLRPAAPAPAAATTSPGDSYRVAMRPALDKLREMAPFLTSAAGSDDGKIATALQPALTSVRTTLATLQAPEKARGSHAMVISAVDGIVAALAPGFAGDRAASVRQSMTTITVVGEVLLSPDLQ